MVALLAGTRSERGRAHVGRHELTVSFFIWDNGIRAGFRTGRDIPITIDIDPMVTGTDGDAHFEPAVMGRWSSYFTKYFSNEMI